MKTKEEIREYEKALESMSPFEIKDTLIKMAQKESKISAKTYLNAGRGNPNWIATAPREAFFLLGQWALETCRNEMYCKPGVAGMPPQDGIGDSLKLYLKDNSARHGAHLLMKALDYAEKTLGISADELAYEWADGIIGDHYPTPVRMLVNSEKIVKAYLAQEMGDKDPGLGKEYDLFATEGGTAAMCYIFNSLQVNHLLNKGDSVALMTPIFTPYIEMPQLDRYSFDVINIYADSVDKDGYHTWQYPQAELDKLRDPKIKLVFLVNPSNPPSYRLSQDCLDYLVDIVKKDNPDLMIVTDDVYGTFAEDFKSLMYILPHNTLCVYSFSKYFGATGWRLAVVAAAKDNIFDRLISSQPNENQDDLKKRYGSLSLCPEKIAFIDRMVADSRDVALNHTAGLSTPQQIQMSLFALMCLLDSAGIYKSKMQTIIKDRLEALWKATGFKLIEDPLRVGYYSEIDIMLWGHKIYGDDFCRWLQENYEPLDVVMRLASCTSVVLLNGSGFNGPSWSVRASLANLDESSYLKIGSALRSIFDGYYQEYKESKA